MVSPNSPIFVLVAIIKEENTAARTINRFAVVQRSGLDACFVIHTIVLNSVGGQSSDRNRIRAHLDESNSTVSQSDGKTAVRI